MTIERKDAPAAFARSLYQTGFAILQHIPISGTLIQQTYQEWAAFFQSDQKHAYTFNPQLQSGYFPFRTEQAKGYSVPDLKEFFHLYAWSELPAGMSDRSWHLFKQLRQLAEQLLEWVEMHSPPAVREKFTMPLPTMIQDSRETLMRPLHYPPLPEEIPPNSVRAAPHEDINLITLLPTATTAGLEILDHQGNWTVVPGEDGDLIVNVGDMLTLASGGYYRSTTHKVVNPTPDAAKQSRFSMPLFLHPRPEVILAGQTTARDYLLERLAELGLLEPSINLSFCDQGISH